MSEATSRNHELYLDEDALGLTRHLRRRGWNVYRCTQSHLIGSAATDPKQLLEATRLQRILISYNRPDYELVHEAWILAGGEHAGILSFHGGANVELENFADAIHTLLLAVTSAYLRNSLRIWHPIDQRWRRFGEGGAT